MITNGLGRFWLREGLDTFLATTRGGAYRELRSPRAGGGGIRGFRDLNSRLGAPIMGDIEGM
jgi:hypothetical protein